MITNVGYVLLLLLGLLGALAASTRSDIKECVKYCKGEIGMPPHHSPPCYVREVATCLSAKQQKAAGYAPQSCSDPTTSPGAISVHCYSVDVHSAFYNNSDCHRLEPGKGLPPWVNCGYSCFKFDDESPDKTYKQETSAQCDKYIFAESSDGAILGLIDGLFFLVNLILAIIGFVGAKCWMPRLVFSQGVFLVVYLVYGWALNFASLAKQNADGYPLPTAVGLIPHGISTFFLGWLVLCLFSLAQLYRTKAMTPANYATDFEKNCIKCDQSQSAATQVAPVPAMVVQPTVVDAVPVVVSTVVGDEPIRVGDHVFWAKSDADIPAGSAGTVTGSKPGDASRITVSFPSGSFNLLAAELTLAAPDK